MRKVFYLACTLAIVAIVFPGCGSGDTNTLGDNVKPVIPPPMPSKPPLKNGGRSGPTPHL